MRSSLILSDSFRLVNKQNAENGSKGNSSINFPFVVIFPSLSRASNFIKLYSADVIAL